MNILKTLKRSFGFGVDEESEEDKELFTDTTEDSSSETPAAKSVLNNTATQSSAAPVAFDTSKQNLIFDKILDVFNDSLPAFVKESVNREAQIEYLRNALDTGVKEYLNSLSQQAEDYCERRWRDKQLEMSDEMNRLKAKAGDIEKRSADIQQKQLSADRQRRALSDRVHDLEAQLAKLEAEREQYELENRSLLNRIRAAGVQQGGEVAQVDRTEEINELNARIAEMTEGIEVLKEQNRVTKEMHDDMRRELAKSRTVAADEQHAHALRERELKEQLAALQAQLGEAREQLAEAQAQIQSQAAVAAESAAAYEKSTDAAAPHISEDELSAIEKTFESEEWFTNTPPAETPSMRPPESESDFGYHEPTRRSSKSHGTHPAQLSLF